MKRLAYLALFLPVVLIGLITRKNMSESSTGLVGFYTDYTDKVYADSSTINANCVGSSCASCPGAT
jgi:hypothetical protein